MNERQNILKSHDASHWLKDQLRDSVKRDPIDLINDLIVLKRVLESEHQAESLRLMHLIAQRKSDLITQSEYFDLI